VAQKFHFAILRFEVTSASRGLSAIAELVWWRYGDGAGNTLENASVISLIRMC